MIVSVEDDGVGFNTDLVNLKQGIGLNSIRNRVQVLGGKLEIISSEGNGAKLIQNDGSTVDFRAPRALFPGFLQIFLNFSSNIPAIHVKTKSCMQEDTV